MKKTLIFASLTLAFSSLMNFALAKEELKIIMRNDTSIEPVLAAAKAEYEKIHPDIEVKIAPITASESDFFAKVALMLKSDDSIDVVLEDSFVLQGDVVAGNLAELPDVEKWDDWKYYFAGSKLMGNVGGKVYGIPFIGDTRGIFYQKEIFKKAGIPTPWQPESWADIVTTAEKIKAYDKSIIPFAFGAAKGEATTMQTFQMFLYGTEDEMYENNKWVTSSKGLLDSFKFIDELEKKGLTSKPSLSTSPTGNNQLNAKYFPKDKVAMMLNGNWMSGDIKKYDVPEKWDFAKMPKQNGGGYTTMAGGWLFAIPAKAKNKAASWELIKFLGSKEVNAKIFETVLNLTARADVAEMESYKKADPIRVIATQFLDFAKYRPATADYPSISIGIQEGVQAIVTGQKTPEEAMADYAKKVKSIVGEANTISK